MSRRGSGRSKPAGVQEGDRLVVVDPSPIHTGVLIAEAAPSPRLIDACTLPVEEAISWIMAREPNPRLVLVELPAFRGDWETVYAFSIIRYTWRDLLHPIAPGNWKPAMKNYRIPQPVARRLADAHQKDCWKMLIYFLQKEGICESASSDPA